MLSVSFSTITTWKKSGESAAYLNMLEQFPDGSVSVVSDSYDVFHAVSNIWGDELRQYVVDRANKGCVVIRPDSGDPSHVVVKISFENFYFAKNHIISVSRFPVGCL